MNCFYEHHRGSIRWHYRCFDRIRLNGLIQPFQQPERVVGFFNTYRQLYPVSRHTLRATLAVLRRVQQAVRTGSHPAAVRRPPLSEAGRLFFNAPGSSWLPMCSATVLY